MPTKNPRLSVVMSPSLAATLAALSEATGDSASSLVRGILEQAEPALKRMLQLVVAAKAARGQIGGGISDSLKRVVEDLQDAIAVADSRTGRAVADLVEAAEAVPRRRRASGGGGGAAHGRRAAGVVSDPRAVTRGSGTGKTRRKGAGSGSV